MYHTPSERMEIGRRVFAHKLTKKEAAAEHDITEQSIYRYVRECLKSAGIDDVPKAIETYIEYFNDGRPSHAFGYLTPKAFRKMYAGKPGQPKKPSRIAYEKKQAAIAKAKAGRKKNERRVYKTSTRAVGFR